MAERRAMEGFKDKPGGRAPRRKVTVRAEKHPLLL
jgi:hypothetical protein